MQISPISSTALSSTNIVRQAVLNPENVFKVLSQAAGGDGTSITKGELAELISSQSEDDKDVNALLKLFSNFDEIAVDGKLTFESFKGNMEMIFGDGSISELSSRTKTALNDSLKAILNNALDELTKEKEEKTSQEPVNYEKYIVDVEQYLTQLIQNPSERVGFIEVFA